MGVAGAEAVAETLDAEGADEPSEAEEIARQELRALLDAWDGSLLGAMWRPY